jgi:hypothetical protein
MRRFVYQLVDRLSNPRAGLSRNRHFALLATPSGQRALKLHRHLRSLETDLARYGARARLTVAPAAEAFVVRLEIPALKLVRTATLTAEDLDVVVHHEGPLAEALAPFARPVRPA